jgi:hypothetical protein
VTHWHFRGDGFDLRTLSFGSDVVFSRLYFAIRDRWWRTVPLSVVDVARSSSPYSLSVQAESANPDLPMDVMLRYAVEGDELVASCSAVARAPFTYCRIGFNLLFPMDAYRNRPATSWRTGAATPFTFPAEILTRDQVSALATRFHRPFERLETGLASGARLRVGFEGAGFEFEDQRNWTDTSYKAYSCAPPSGWPASAVSGERFFQRIRIRVSPRSGRIRLGAPTGVMPSIDLFAGRVSPHSYRPGGGFQEFNSRRPRLAGYDSIELAVNGAVHAADDESVQETTAAHGLIVAQSRALQPALPVRLVPISFLDVAGDWRDDAGEYSPEPPKGPLPARLLTGFAATWVIASASFAVPAGPDLLRYFDASLPAGSPAARAVARLRDLAGRDVLAVEAPTPLAVLAVRLDDAVVLAVANPSPDRTEFGLPDGRPMALGAYESAWYLTPTTLVKQVLGGLGRHD